MHGTDLCSSLEASVITCGGRPAKPAPSEVSRERAECPRTGKCLVAILFCPLVRQRAARPSDPCFGYGMKSDCWGSVAVLIKQLTINSDAVLLGCTQKAMAQPPCECHLSSLIKAAVSAASLAINLCFGFVSFL